MKSNNLTAKLMAIGGDLRLGILYDPSQGYLLTERDGQALPRARLLGADFDAAEHAVREMAGEAGDDGPVVW